MKALTICQPYAHLIAIGEKRVENRTWATAYRGPLAIHAGKSRKWLELGDVEEYPDMQFGSVVAVARLASCVPFAAVNRGALPAFKWLVADKYASGPWCWILEDVRRLGNPIPATGRQGLFNIEIPEIL
jgi:hypothetical protein